MKAILTIIGILLVVACSQNKTEHQNDVQIISETQTNSRFQEYFQDLDTTSSNNSIGCSSGFYKILDNKYVIRISPNLDFEYGNIKKNDSDSYSKGLVMDLLEFEEGEANITNICTDIHMVNTSQPIQKYSNFKGTVVIGKSDPTDYYGNLMPRVSIHLDNVMFYDSLGNEQLKIEDELLWKVLHQGTPG